MCTRSVENWGTYRLARNKCNNAVKLAKRTYIQQQANTLANGTCSTSTWWKNIRQLCGLDKRNSESHLPPLRTQCGNFVIKDEEKAELLNSVYIEQNTSLLSDNKSFPYGPTNVRMKFCLKHVSPVEVGKTVQSLPRNIHLAMMAFPTSY